MLLTKGVAERFPDLGDELYDEQARLEALRDRRRARPRRGRAQPRLVRVAEAALERIRRGSRTRAAGSISTTSSQRALALLQNGRRGLGALQARPRRRPFPGRRGAGHFARAMGDPAPSSRRISCPARARARGGAPSSRSATRSSRSSRSRARRRRCSTRCGASSSAATTRPSCRSSRVSLHLSFRSAPQLLEAVDRVFALDRRLARRQRGRGQRRRRTAPSMPTCRASSRSGRRSRRAGARARGLAHAARRAERRATRRSALAERIAAVDRRNGSRRDSRERVIDKPTRGGRAASVRATSSSWCARAARFFEAMTRALRRARRSPPPAPTG